MFPVHDWQFWVATGLAAGAVAYLVRRLVPRGASRRRTRSARRATLTVEGRAVDSKR